ncbi:ead/Ea22-like family protein [Escherichia coli]
MSNIDKQALREIAAAAVGAHERLSVMPPDDIFDISLAEGTQLDADITALNALNSAANPATVLALLDELEAAEKRIAEQQSAIIAPGIMRCAGCGFVLTKNSINMAAGTITAGDSKTEPCPNGCGPLWPVTWKEQALQMRDDSEQWFIELQQAKNRIAELEARTVKLPEYRNSPDMHTKQFYEAIGFNQGLDVFIEALRAAGIGVKGE